MADWGAKQKNCAIMVLFMAVSVIPVYATISLELSISSFLNIKVDSDHQGLGLALQIYES